MNVEASLIALQLPLVSIGKNFEYYGNPKTSALTITFIILLNNHSNALSPPIFLSFLSLWVSHHVFFHLFPSRLSDHIKLLCGKIRFAGNMISVSLKKALNKLCSSFYSVTLLASSVTCDLPYFLFLCSKNNNLSKVIFTIYFCSINFFMV